MNDHPSNETEPGEDESDAHTAPDLLPVSDAQRAEVLRRSEEYRRNPSMAIPLEDALDRIQRSLG
jgi:putative addiction module component (TIGR02574 family)